LHEAVACVFLVVPFFAAHDFGVDLSGQCALGVVDGVDDLPECDLADDQQVHITVRPFCGFGHGAKDESHFDLGRQLLQGMGQHVGQACGFAYQPGQFGVNRVVCVGTELDLVAHFLVFEQSCVAERV